MASSAYRRPWPGQTKTGGRIAVARVGSDEHLQSSQDDAFQMLAG
nr:Hypothetical protein [Pseudomonas aeruginosa]